MTILRYHNLRLNQLTFQNGLSALYMTAPFKLRTICSRFGDGMNQRMRNRMICPMCDGPIIRLESEEWIIEECPQCVSKVLNHRFPSR